MPDIDPDLPLRLAKTVADIYGDAATQLLQAVARRLARGIDEPGWAESKMAELVGLRDEARAVVDRLTVLGPDAVREALTAAADKGATAAATELAATLKPATSTPAVEALAEQTISQLDRTHMQILRATDDVYRRVIAEVSAPGVVTGSLTQQQAAARALDRFAQKGVTGFVDRAGRRWELESYVEMATRTASGRAMIDGRLDVYEAEGRDVVIVSDAPEECAVCRPFEGRLLSISGQSVGQTIDGKRVIDSVKGAQAKGLHHPNCRHDLRPYIPGLTKPVSGTADPEGDRLRQEQRRLERRIREAKRRVAAAEPFGDPELGRAKARLKQRQADMRKFVADHDRKRFPEREKLRGPKSGDGPRKPSGGDPSGALHTRVAE